MEAIGLSVVDRKLLEQESSLLEFSEVDKEFHSKTLKFYEDHHIKTSYQVLDVILNDPKLKQEVIAGLQQNPELCYYIQDALNEVNMLPLQSSVFKENLLLTVEQIINEDINWEEQRIIEYLGKLPNIEDEGA
ncbi:hypothetical protein Trichorick_00284 [Candidatus Trichorickettsia mobilis]|uniref:Uncharacterized protein n=1 Tax=Candidatus Trichorickettsia mobilis TaxID=1346319 RepID=A0ABZ0UQT5_9RICK|nr:hypothetical protein [Candidatus Trichorickettsia mobilis]WPY00410.1 hypothetical protein Trichorick_00284 [Candidatus Trichorickettsia mobilis]